VVDANSFRVKLEQAMLQYQNRALDTAQIIEQLIEMAKDLRDAHRRGEDLGLTEDELAFYDALEVGDSAVRVLGDETLKAIARELVQAVKASLTIDWAVRESARAKLRTIVKRLLRKYGYPPDMQEKATDTVIQQAEVLSQMWVG
jgi:type I restriction enzyme R subunit